MASPVEFVARSGTPGWTGTCGWSRPPIWSAVGLVDRGAYPLSKAVASMTYITRAELAAWLDMEGHRLCTTRRNVST